MHTIPIRLIDTIDVLIRIDGYVKLFSHQTEETEIIRLLQR